MIAAVGWGLCLSAGVFAAWIAVLIWLAWAMRHEPFDTELWTGGADD